MEAGLAGILRMIDSLWGDAEDPERYDRTLFEERKVTFSFPKIGSIIGWADFGHSGRWSGAVENRANNPAWARPPFGRLTREQLDSTLALRSDNPLKVHAMKQLTEDALAEEPWTVPDPERRWKVMTDDEVTLHHGRTINQCREDAQAEKLRGAEYDSIYMDEATQLRATVWDLAATRPNRKALLYEKFESWVRSDDDPTIRNCLAADEPSGGFLVPENIVIQKNALTFETGPGSPGAALFDGIIKRHVDMIFSDMWVPDAILSPEPVNLTVEHLIELHKTLLDRYRPLLPVRDMTYEGRPVRVINPGDEPNHEESIDMKFSTFTLKADGASLGNRQLIDVPQDMCVRFAELEDDAQNRRIRVTYTQPSVTTAKPRATAFVVIDSQGDAFDCANFEDRNAPGGIKKGQDDYGDTDPNLVHRIASADGVLVFEAL